ncbi:transposase [Streptomyces sp. V4I8]
MGRDVSGQLRVRRQALLRQVRPGDPWLKNALGLAATAAARSKNTYLASRYKRIAIRRGKKRAMVAVGHTILTSIWHMLSNDAEYADLGADYFLQRTGRCRRTS